MKTLTYNVGPFHLMLLPFQVDFVYTHMYVPFVKYA